MQRITSALVLFLLSVFNLIADPSDYGKDYSFREGHSNTPIWFVILVIVGIWTLYKLFYGVISKLDDINNPKNNKGHHNVLNKTETTAISSIYPTQYKCNSCFGTGWNSVLQDITHLRKKCCKCEGKGFIASRNYISIQLQINDLEKRISNQFENYINLLSNKLKIRIAVKREFYTSIGEEYLDYDEALIKIEEVRNNLKASRSYKRLYQLYENETRDFCKNSDEFTPLPRFCYRLLSCNYCMIPKCKMRNFRYKKLKILYDIENKKLIDEYIHLIIKYSEYLKLDDRKKHGKVNMQRPFDKWIKNLAKERYDLLQSLAQEREACPKCEDCKGNGYFINDPNLVMGQNVIVKNDLFETKYYLKTKCLNCNGTGLLPNNQ